MKNKVKKIGIIFVLFSSIALISACEKDTKEVKLDDYYDNAAEIHIDLQAPTLCFDFCLLTKDKIDEIVYVDCEGENIESSQIKVNLTNNSMESYADEKVNGLYCSDWMIDMEFENEGYYEIESVILNVNGEKRTINFEEPLKYTNGSCNDIFNDELYCATFPCEFPSSMINSNDIVEYKLTAGAECVFEGVQIKDYIDVNDAEYYVNNSQQKTELPINLKSGDDVVVRIKFDNCKDGIDKYSYIMTNLEYMYKFDDCDYVRRGAIVFNPISPMDDKKEKLYSFVDKIVKE